MRSNKLTHSQFARQQVVETFSDLIYYSNERGSTNISQILLYSAIIDDIRCDVHWYSSTGFLPFDEFSEEPAWMVEVEWKALILNTRLSVGNDEDFRKAV